MKISLYLFRNSLLRMKWDIDIYLQYIPHHFYTLEYTSLKQKNKTSFETSSTQKVAWDMSVQKYEM